MIHLRVVSSPDVIGTLTPVLPGEPAVMTLMVPAGALGHPDGDAVHVDVLQGTASEVINRLRDLGPELRGWRSMA